MNIAIIDNYDSFTYNLVHLIQGITNMPVAVHLNDAISIAALDVYDTIIISPGPGVPNDAGIIVPVIQQYAPYKRILGVCLGHQAIGVAFGAKLTNLAQVYHGIATECIIKDEQALLFNGITNPCTVGRYHSWVINEATLPTEIKITATDEQGHIMAIQHNTYNVHGVQFHPESILTPIGAQLMQNFLSV